MEELNMAEIAVYIADEMLKKGVVILSSDVEMILDLETQYMIEKGYAFPAEDV